MKRKLMLGTAGLATIGFCSLAGAETHSITLRATNQKGQSVEQSYTLTVSAGDHTEWLYVPESGSVPAFAVSKYEMKGTAPAVPAAGAASDLYSWTQCRSGCQAIGEGYDMIRESQWNRIAHDLLPQSKNWSGGAAGTGKLFNGISAGGYGGAAAIASSTNDADGYLGAVGSNQFDRRTMVLSTGEVIWDLSGGRAEWTYADDGRTYASGGKATDYHYTGTYGIGAELNNTSPPASNADIKPGGSYTNALHNVGLLFNSSAGTNVPIVRGAQAFTNYLGDAYGRGIFKLSLDTITSATNGCRCVLNDPPPPNNPW